LHDQVALRRCVARASSLGIVVAFIALGGAACLHTDERADQERRASAFERLGARPFREPRISMRPGRCVFPPRFLYGTGGPVYVKFQWGVPNTLHTTTGDTVWSSTPAYRGPVLVRGRRLDARGTVEFGSFLRRSPELRLPAGSWDEDTKLARKLWPRAVRAGWRFSLARTWVDSDGCYALQVDGESFSDVVLFASTP
jgi:hypothetical protein